MTYCECQKLHDEKCERCEHHGASGDGGKMSNENQETIADIVADIRAQNQGLPEDSYALSPLVCDLLSFADRIEAAATREREAGAEAAQICGEVGEMIGREAACENSSQVGNAAAMREALNEARRFVLASAQRADRDLLVSDEKRGVYVLTPKDTLAKIDAALSAPPRNCDVGTEVEHIERHIKFCKGYKCGPGTSCYVCFAKWSQMPYEEGGAE